MVDEHILKQLDSDANVIGYQPKLKYEKDRTATGTFIGSQETENYDPEKDTTLYTKTLNSFSENTPSSVLSDIAYVLKNIDRLKQNLAERFKEEQASLDNPYYNENYNNLSDTEIILNNANDGKSYNPYNDINKLIDAGKNGHTDFTKQFEDKYNTVNGSVIPALINYLTNIENKLSDLNDNLKRFYYNDPNITISDAKESDNSYLRNMRMFERNGNYEKINYMTLSLDSTLNKMISYTVFQDNKSAIKVAKVIDSRERAKATSNDMDIIKDLFEEVKNELDTRSKSYMKNNNLELIQKSIYNYYEKRKHLNDIYELYYNNQDSKFLGRKVIEYSTKVNDAIKNVSRVLMYNQSCLDRITVLEKQKYNLQRISKTTSSNS